MHTPVLLQPALESLDIQQGEKYIDATYGEGGHTREMLKLGAQVLSIDADLAKQVNIDNSNFKFVYGNFANIEEIAKANDFYPVSGVLFDLGLSMEQIAKSGRGFTFKNDEEPLDMRLDTNQEVTASKILNSYSQNELYEMFSKNCEEPASAAISQSIVIARQIKKFKTVGDLKSSLRSSESVVKRIFQALRIEVNQEFENLRAGLLGAVSIVRPGGRISVITFHSLEDRIVKQFAIKNNLQLLDKKAVKSKSGKSFEKTAILRTIIKS